MNSIYEILKKHFLGEASQADEEKVKSFKKENPFEYQMLHILWWSKIPIRVKDYDTDAAWQRILARIERRQARTIPLYRKLARIAAAAAILIAVTFAFYQVNQKVFRNELVVSTDQTNHGQEIILSDGSVVWLNDTTRFGYPKEFKGKTRRVSLEGEAYFKIAKNPNKPFIIETVHSEVKVLGTSFNVNTNNIETNVAVLTGKVNVKSRYNNSNVNLDADYMAVVTKNEIRKSKVENPNFIAWKTGKFEFKNTPLTEVVRDLNSFYSKKIIIKNTYAHCNFTADFDNAKLPDILQVLVLTCNIQITEKENNYEIQ